MFFEQLFASLDSSNVMRNSTAHVAARPQVPSQNQLNTRLISAIRSKSHERVTELLGLKPDPWKCAGVP